MKLSKITLGISPNTAYYNVTPCTITDETDTCYLIFEADARLMVSALEKEHINSKVFFPFMPFSMLLECEGQELMFHIYHNDIYPIELVRGIISTFAMDFFLRNGSNYDAYRGSLRTLIL